MYCAPTQDKKLDNTCYSLNKLKKIADLYNKFNKHNKIVYNAGIKPQELYNLIRTTLNDKCGNNEICWIQQPFVQKSQDPDLLKYTFRPPKPKGGKYMWLSTTDLDNVMRQYEKAYSNFKFLGALPIDFSKVWRHLVYLKYDKLYKEGITKIGVIFNTDPSYKSGEHWMSMFINLNPNNPNISFYDSTVTCPPPKEISDYIKYIKKYEPALQELWGNKNTIKINCNNIQHQKKNSECGTYSLYYITESLRGLTFEEISKKIVRDEEMNKLRDKFYSPAT